MLVGAAHDERAERAHFLVEQADRVMLGIVAAEAVRTDHFSEPVTFVRWGRIAAPAHLTETDLAPGFGELPGSFRSGKASADDVNVEGHRLPIAVRPRSTKSLRRPLARTGHSFYTRGK
jgi:hypothetical protein